VHPNARCEAYDHRDWALWAGTKHDLNFSCLHYDCPGCTMDDCRDRGRRVVLAGGAERCGLAVAGASEPRLEVGDRPTCCTPACARWAGEVLPAWAAECPSNCDLFPGSRECAAHASSVDRLAAAARTC